MSADEIREHLTIKVRKLLDIILEDTNFARKCVGEADLPVEHLKNIQANSAEVLGYVHMLKELKEIVSEK